MSLYDVEIIDFISIDPDGNVALSISDDWEWDGRNEHLFVLQKKMNSYLRFVESGQIVRDYPNSKGRKVVMSIVAKYEPNEDALFFLKEAEKVLKGGGYDFRFKVLK